MTYVSGGVFDTVVTCRSEVHSVKQMNVIATACLGGIVVAFTYMFDFFPLYAFLAYLGVLGYVAFAPEGGAKKAQPAEPWYMK